MIEICCIFQKYLQASDFLQNVVYINLQTSEEDKVQKYSTLSSLYSQTGFQRKAAFFKRIAAMQCVAPQCTKPSWYQCYTLLLQTLDGYGISLDPKEFLQGGHTTGWPVIQLRILNELVFSARRMGNPQLTVRHMSFLLHTMHDHLSAQEKREAATALETFTSQCEGTPQPIALESGMILPPVSLTKIPLIKSFKPLPLPPHLQPQKLMAQTPVMERVTDSSPFIYSPFAQNNNTEKEKSQMDFLWVSGDICEVGVQIYNPMPDDLKVTQMGLLTEGVEFDTFPATPTFPAESGPCCVKLVGLPKSHGELSIIGYSTHVFGVRSLCKLKELPLVGEPVYHVEVVPALPHVQLTTSLPKAASFFSSPEGANIVTSATTALYAGQSQECMVTLQNVGIQPVEMVEISLEDKYNTGILENVFTWNRENITSQLPLMPGSIGCFTLCIYGASDFVSNQGTDDDLVISPSRSFWGSRNVRSGTMTSIDGSSSDTVCVETMLRVQYSGGPGLEGSYCRHSAVALSVDIQPSLAFCKWDVLPSDSPDHCYLVLDGRNEGRHQMDVQYGSDLNITIEPNQVRRFAVHVRKVDFSVMGQGHSKQVTDPNSSECQGHSTSAQKLEEGKVECHSSCVPGISSAEGPNSALISDLEAYRFSSLIASHVDIRWSVSMLKVCGRASIEHLPWSDAQLAMIQLSPLTWELMMNCEVCTPSVPVVVRHGELVSLDIRLTSTTDCLTLDNMLLSVSWYQDHGNGCHDYRTKNEVITMGTSIVPLQEIYLNGVCHHSCDFLFNGRGMYNLGLKCVVNSSDISSKSFTNAGRNETLSEWTCLPAPRVEVRDSADLSVTSISTKDRSASSQSVKKGREGLDDPVEFTGTVQYLEEKSVHLNTVNGEHDSGYVNDDSKESEVMVSPDDTCDNVAEFGHESLSSDSMRT